MLDPELIRNIKCLLYLTVLMFLLSPGAAWAHALDAEWVIKGERVDIEAYFSDNTRAQAALVRVFKLPQRDKAIMEMKTDAQGKCTWPCPGPGKYLIVVDAGGGHRKELPPLEIIEPPLQLASVTLALGSAALGGPGNFSLAVILFLGRADEAPRKSPGPSREEFTSYPWHSVLQGVAGITVAALLFWLLRRGST
jgi:hypothetical protein